MARVQAKLSALEVRNAKPRLDGKALVLADGGGLRLLVMPNGSKYWQFRTSSSGKETTIQLGSYPQVDLARARDEAEKLRRMKRSGQDVRLERRLDKLRQEKQATVTLKLVAEELVALKRQNGAAESYVKKIESALKANLYPNLGHVPLSKISSSLLKTELAAIAARGSLDMLSFVLRIMGEVFDLAKADGRFVGDNPAHALRRNVFPKHKKGQMAALPWDAMPAFLHRLDGFRGEFVTEVCIRLMLWTATRPGEARMAMWSEFDLDAGRWTIPAQRMKMRQPHAVPLPRQAVTLLRRLQEITGHQPHLFPGQRRAKNSTISDMTLLKAIRRTVGHDDVTAHGFRAVFRTRSAEALQWPDNVLEAALAHGKKNAVVGAYDRATYYDERKALLQWYADELERVCRPVSHAAVPSA